MTTKTIKTILFASLIAAMILPFSGMQSANAVIEVEEPDVTTFEEAQQRLVDKLVSVDEKLETVKDDKAKERFLDLRQEILKHLLDRSRGYLGSTEFIEVSTDNPEISTDIPTQDFYLDGSFSYCDGISEAWNYSGVVADGEKWVAITQDFPIIIADKDCGQTEWAGAITLKLQPVFAGEGCFGILDVDAVSNYWVNCETPINDLWIIAIHVDYGEITQTHYTSVFV